MDGLTYMHRSHGILLLLLFLSFFLFQSQIFFISISQKNEFKQPSFRTHDQINPITTIQNNHEGISSFTTKNSSSHFLSSGKTSAKAQSTKLSTYSSGFISTWNTSNHGVSNATTITLPLVSTGTYDFNVSWGDGQTSTITIFNSVNVTHTYVSAGVYTLNITGVIYGWEFNGGGDAPKLIQISHWGGLRLGNAGHYFEGASNLVLTANDSLDLNGTTSLQYAFANCSSLGAVGTMNRWDTAGIFEMSDMFEGASSFNQPVSAWDVSHVGDMSGMFWGATSFNQSLASWAVQNVGSMGNMFEDATSFNQPLTSWDVSSVMVMSGMFWNATSFNQNIDQWAVFNVWTMASMFEDATSFNQPLNSWDVSAVLYMRNMFLGATSFNQPLNSWDVSHVQDISFMFEGVTTFNQNLGSWNVSSVRFMNFALQGDNLSVANYDSLLIGWSKLPVQSRVVFNAGFSKYNSSALKAREFLINHFHWTITDGGAVVSLTTTSNSSFNLSGSFLQIFSLVSVLVMVCLLGAGFLVIDYHKHRNKINTKTQSFSFRQYLRSRFKFHPKKQESVTNLSDHTLEMIDEIIKENEE